MLLELCFDKVSEAVRDRFWDRKTIPKWLWIEVRSAEGCLLSQAFAPFLDFLISPFFSVYFMDHGLEPPAI